MPVEVNSLDIPCGVYQVNSERWTFADETVRRWAQERLDGDVLNACAGETQLKYDGEIHRNDVNTDREADTYANLKVLDEVLGEDVFDTVVYDPPWSVFQVNDKYDGRGQDTIKQSTLMAQSIDTMLRPGGKVLGFGYTMDMIPSGMGYELTGAAVFTIPGPGKDFFGSVHTKVDRDLSEYW